MKAQNKLRSPVFVCLFLFIICLSVYFSSLNNDFIFDDNFIVVKNIYIKNFAFLPKLFKIDIFHFAHPENPSLGKYYRPLQALSYSVDYFFWKLNPAGYRLVNILIHSLNAFLLFLLVRVIFKDNLFALLSAVLFCVHPIQASDVAFISVRAVPLALLFMLLSIITSIKYFLHNKRPCLYFSLFFFAFALLSWETSLLLPLLIILCAFFSGVDKKKILWGILPFVFTAMIYLIFRSRFIPCDKLYPASLFSIKNLNGYLYHAGDYFSQLIIPAGFQKIILNDSTALKIIFLFFSLSVFSFSLIKAVFFKNRKAGFALIFYFIAMLPLFRLWDTIPFFGAVVSEHYVYIASAGFFMLISCLLLDLRRYLRRAAVTGIFLLIAGYSFLTIINNANYKDDITFYNHIISLDRENTLVRVNLGTAYYQKKLYDKAKEQAVFVLSRNPFEWEAVLLLGNISKDKGELQKAAELYRKVLMLYPKSSKAFNNLALIYSDAGSDKQALENFRKAVELDPESLLILKNFCGFLVKRKLYADALLYCKKILELSSENVDARIILGIIFAESGNFKEAEALFKEAQALNPASFDALKNLGVLYANAGDLDRAISVWEKALALDPSSAEITNNLKDARRLRSER